MHHEPEIFGLATRPDFPDFLLGVCSPIRHGINPLYHSGHLTHAFWGRKAPGRFILVGVSPSFALSFCDVF
jgi:hypothetical protein